MKQVLQSLDARATQVREVASPLCGPREVLIANTASLISAGTEKAVVDLATKSLLAKARQRPDEVRRVLQKSVREGILDTLQQVRARLAEPIALGYSSAGVVLEVGREVARFRPGDRVASNGAHAEIVAVSQRLVARIPDAVPFDEACYAAVAAVPLHALRLAQTGLGDRVAILGLGVVGQIAVQLCRATGSRVIATDPDPIRRRMAAELGAEVAGPDELAAVVERATEAHGADAVLIAASGADSRALEIAAAIARKKARIIAVGAVGLDVPRREFYAKELELVVSCSYGPGRYDRQYEQNGIDYPYAYVRWTEQRNLEAVLEQIAHGRLDVRHLTTHRFAIAEAVRAYELIANAAEPHLAVVLTYPAPVAERAAAISLKPSPAGGRPAGELGIGLLGSGRFTAAVLAPSLQRTSGARLRIVCSAGGVRATVLGERHGFERATASIDEVLNDPAVAVVFVATPHYLHSEQAMAALAAGKHVFVEKPLAVTADQLHAFGDALAAHAGRAPIWTVGFNRRFSAAASRVADFFAGVAEPLTLSYRFNAGALPPDHWAHDPEVGGGRLIGEACHALDFAAFLLGGQVASVFAACPAVPGAGGSGDDQAAIVARLDNGAVASIGYFAGGNTAFPKERIELFGGGRVAVIDDFRSVTLSTAARTRRRRLFTRDKGHAAQIQQFFTSIRTGERPPVPYSSLLNVSWAAVLVVDSLKTGLPVDVPLFSPETVGLRVHPCVE